MVNRFSLEVKCMWNKLNVESHGPSGRTPRLAMMRMQPMLVAMILLGCLRPGAQAQGEGREGSPAVVNPVAASPLRQAISLDGTWDFATDPQKIGEAQHWFDPGTALPGKQSIQVPGCWEAQGIGGPGLSTTVTPERSVRPLKGSYVGAAWYRKAVTIPLNWGDKRVWLKVGGVNAQGWFWVNGQFVARLSSYCGTYKYDVTDLVKPGETATVAALVRNDVPSFKGLFGWIHRFGGIYRSVELEATPARLVDYAYVDGIYDEKKASVHVRLRSTGGSGADQCEVTVKISALTGEKAGAGTGSVTLAGAGTQEVVVDAPLSPFNAWSPEHPNLYKAEITLRAGGREIDGWVERFGVKKIEVRGDRFFLNNQPCFIRGYGDDFVYPLTLTTPASREEHRKRLAMAKAYGFGYVRHHTHCEIPEYYEMADELGIMVQPELPYYGPQPSDGVFRPKEDLLELDAHYRRYVSFTTFCTGNEGWLGSPADVEVYKLAKEIDPLRLAQHQDGGKNTPENSDFGTGPITTWPAGSFTSTRPYFCHEYMNLATMEDPRLAAKYSGVIKPSVTPETFKGELDQAGLSWEWGMAILDGGNTLQRIYQKQGLEHARLEPGCDGYIYWTIADVGFPAAQGLFNQFWEVKPNGASAEYFREFNRPTAILAQMNPADQILGAGDQLEVDWRISAFDTQAIADKTLNWKIEADGKTLAQDVIAGVNAATGDVKSIGKSVLVAPAVDRAVKARLVVELAETGIRNSWDIWLFPQPKTGEGRGLAASEGIYRELSQRYPGLARAGSPEADAAGLLLTDKLDQAAMQTLAQGKNVLLLRLSGPNPGVHLGWWGMSGQTGTAVARHPAFGDFPHEGVMNQLFFRLIKGTTKAGEAEIKTVEPLMVGSGNQGYLIHVFQAKAGRGKLLASGLDLLSGKSEAAYLLDQFIAYARSERFQPQGSFDLEQVRARMEEADRLAKSMNGWSQTLRAVEKQPYNSFMGVTDMAIVRLNSGDRSLDWRTQPVPRELDPAKDFTFKWAAGMGYMSEPGGTLTLRLNGKDLIDFEPGIKKATWHRAEGKITLQYESKTTNDIDGSGYMTLTLPASMLKPGEPANLSVAPKAGASRRWFGVYETPAATP